MFELFNYILPLPGQSPVQHHDGQHQTDILPGPAGGARQSHGHPEWAGQNPPSSAGSLSAQGGHGGQRDGGELQVESGIRSTKVFRIQCTKLYV